MKKIDNSDGRFYIKEGKPYVSVTTHLGMIAKGKHFEGWLMRNGLDSERIKNASAESGTKVHGVCELLQKEGKANVELLNKEEHKKCQGFINWVGNFKPKFMEAEIQVYSERLGYAGTIDIICEIEKEIWLVDIKTGNYVHEEAWYQTAAYLEACKEMGIKVDKRAVLHLKSKTKIGYQFIDDSEHNLKNDFQAYRCAKFLWDAKHPSAKPYKEKKLPKELKL